MVQFTSTFASQPQPAAVSPLGSVDLIDTLLLAAVGRALGLESAPSRGGLPRWRLQRVTRHIEDNISNRLSISELAGVAQMSASHFSRTFRATVGVSPHGYVTRRRVAAAQALIATADHPLAEVAIMCGTADQAHLNRLFARHCGVTPGAWRRALLWARAHGTGMADSLTTNNRVSLAQVERR